jgi:hypothetical protein
MTTTTDDINLIRDLETHLKMARDSAGRLLSLLEQTKHREQFIRIDQEAKQALVNNANAAAKNVSDYETKLRQAMEDAGKPDHKRNRAGPRH